MRPYDARGDVRALLALILIAPIVSGQAFVDVTEAVGAGFAHVEGSNFGMSGGNAWLDVEGDGDDDLLITRGDGLHRLLINTAGAFTDGTAAAGDLIASVAESTMGVAVGDVDQDGLPDIVLLNNGPNRLLLNQGGGVFRDVTSAHPAFAQSAWSTSAAFADFDRDGDLDLFEANYIAVIQFPYHIGSPNRLLVNEGTRTDPVFVDRAPELGLDGVGVFGRPVPGFEAGAPAPGDPTAGCTLSVCTLDYDDDGDPDLLVGNDFGLFVLPSRVYRNDSPMGGPLVFTDVSEETGIGLFLQYNMGINPADYDRDGDFDLYLSDLGPNLMLRNDDGFFVDVTAAAGPVEGYADGGDLLLTSWGTLWADMDNDGWEDLYVVNGFIPAAAFIANEIQAPNALWMNRRDGSFERIDGVVSGLDDTFIGRGVAATDMDGDGWLDLHLVNNGGTVPGIEGPGRLFRNSGSLGNPDHGWWAARLTGVFSNVEGLGARITLLAGGGIQKRQVRADPVYLSSPSRWVHFGLGPTRRVDQVVIDWPSGVRNELFDLRAGRRREIIEPRVVVLDLSAPQRVAGGWELLARVTNLDDVEQRARVDQRLMLDGRTVFRVESQVAVGAGETVGVTALAPLLGLSLGSDGFVWTVRVTDEVSAAVDMARRSFGGS